MVDEDNHDANECNADDDGEQDNQTTRQPDNQTTRQISTDTCGGVHWLLTRIAAALSRLYVCVSQYRFKPTSTAAITPLTENDQTMAATTDRTLTIVPQKMCKRP
jgi:hypothetical protein